MTRFEDIGVSHQVESRSVAQAVKRFETSCTICATRGIRIECDSCAIRMAHEHVVADLTDLAEINRKKIDAALKGALKFPEGLHLI